MTGERMTYKPYVLKRRHLGGDMWASSLLAANHGLILLKSFAEWVSADLLLGQGLIGLHDANCAFTRSAGGPLGRLLLVNFTPPQPLLAPVLFDQHPREFVLIADEAPPALRALGVAQAPLGLGADAALEWLAAEEFAVDFEEVLEEGRKETFAFSLFKSA
jgi:hypothetical protein